MSRHVCTFAYIHVYIFLLSVSKRPPREYISFVSFIIRLMRRIRKKKKKKREKKKKEEAPLVWSFIFLRPLFRPKETIPVSLSCPICRAAFFFCFLFLRCRVVSCRVRLLGQSELYVSCSNGPAGNTNTAGTANDIYNSHQPDMTAATNQNPLSRVSMHIPPLWQSSKKDPCTPPATCNFLLSLSLIVAFMTLRLSKTRHPPGEKKNNTGQRRFQG